MNSSLPKKSFFSSSFQNASNLAILEEGINILLFIIYIIPDMNPRMGRNDLNSYKKNSGINLPISPPISKSSFREKLFEKATKIHIKNEEKEIICQKNINLETRLEKSSNMAKSLKSSIYLDEEFKKNKKFLKSPTQSPKPQNKKNKSPPFEKKKKTLFEVLSNFYITKKFISNLRSISSYRTPKFLSKIHFSLINDRIFFFEIWSREKKNEEKILEKNSDQSRVNRIISFFKMSMSNGNKIVFNLFEKIPVFDFNSKTIFLWNLIHIFLILVLLFAIPIEICFSGEVQKGMKYFVQIFYFACCFFTLDILINCNVSIYQKGKLITQRKKIAIYYFQNLFIKDILSLFCIFWHVVKDYNGKELGFYLETIVNILFFLRLRNLFRLLKNTKEMFFINQSVHHIISLINLIFRIILLSHIFACLWFYIGTLYPNDSWLSAYELHQEPWNIKYLYSYYFICVTMNTVGYGDIGPTNPAEKIFVIIFIYVACAMFAYSINSIGIIVSELAKRENDLQKNLNVINNFMKKKQINYDLQMKVRKNLEYIWREEQIENLEEENKIINSLSDYLKQELLLEANGSILKEIKMFVLNFSEDLLREMVPLLNEVRFAPGDLIFMKGDSNNKDLYIMKTGMVEIFSDTQNPTILKTLKEKEVFGEISFFSDQERKACAKSVDYTSAFKLKKDDFFCLLRKYPYDYEKFCKIKDSINLYEDYSDLHIKCYSCQGNAHLIQECPNIKYIPMKEIILNRHYISIPQTRELFLRKNFKFKALKNQTMIQQKSFDIQENFSPTFLSEDESYENEELLYATQNEDNEFLSKNEVASNYSESQENDEEIKENLLKTKTLESKFVSKSFNEKQTGSTQEKEIKLSSQEFDYKITKKNLNNSNFDQIAKKFLNYYESLSKVSQIKNNNETITIDSLKNLSFNEEEKKNMIICSNEKFFHDKEKLSIIKNFMKFLKDSQFQKQDSKLQKEDLKINEKELKIKEPTQIPEKETLSLITYDVLKSWDFYYPKNNFKLIIDKANIINRMKKKSYKISTFRSEKIANLSDQMLSSFVNQTQKKISKFTSNFRKDFFQSAFMKDKLAKEARFDPKKFKENYEKNIKKNKDKRKIFDILINGFRSLIRR